MTYMTIWVYRTDGRAVFGQKRPTACGRVVVTGSCLQKHGGNWLVCWCFPKGSFRPKFSPAGAVRVFRVGHERGGSFTAIVYKGRQGEGSNCQNPPTVRSDNQKLRISNLGRTSCKPLQCLYICSCGCFKLLSSANICILVRIAAAC